MVAHPPVVHLVFERPMLLLLRAVSPRMQRDKTEIRKQNVLTIMFPLMVLQLLNQWGSGTEALLVPYHSRPVPLQRAAAEWSSSALDLRLVVLPGPLVLSLEKRN
jgi:hypothetical protein